MVLNLSIPDLCRFSYFQSFNDNIKIKISVVYVVSNKNRNVNLGRDFFKNNNVALYYNLGRLRIPFEQHI